MIVQLTQIECALHMYCITDYIHNFTNLRFLFRNENAQLENLILAFSSLVNGINSEKST